MQEAQHEFREVVQRELNELLRRGVERERAVRTLLRRIVKDSIEPCDEDVQQVMSTFSLSREDATRALIVKQELGMTGSFSSVTCML
jgi:hypothetical protein